MAIQLNFDADGAINNPTLVLCERYGKKIGIINYRNITLKDAFNSFSEMSFIIDKSENPHLWDSLIDFKIVWCKEFNLYFELNVTIDETNDKIKTCTCKSLAECELSQIYIYGLEVNTENDKARKDYTPTILYNSSNAAVSLIDKILAYSPNYEITHIDTTLTAIKKAYSFDDVTVYDALQTIASDINCIFIFEAVNDNTGKIKRQIKVYDLESNCLDCGYRGEFTDVCPDCESDNIVNGYGTDTQVYITVDNLADEIQYSCNVDNVKNSFKLIGGDDTMTAAIKACNPNGGYIWYLPDSLRETMSNSLQSKLLEYDSRSEYYNTTYTASIDSTIKTNFNTVLTKYKPTETTCGTVQGFPAIVSWNFKAEDLRQYIQSGLMPTAATPSATTAQAVYTYINSCFNSIDIEVEDATKVNENNAQSTFSAMLKVWIDDRYSYSISNLSFNSTAVSCTFSLTITNKTDDTDTYTGMCTAVFDASYKDYIGQLIQKELYKHSSNIDMIALFGNGNFSTVIENYCTDALIDIEETAQSIVDTLAEKSIGNNTLWTIAANNLYTLYYTPYISKLNSIKALIRTRNTEDNIIIDFQKVLTDRINYVKSQLNFNSFLGTTLLKEFISYKRESTYKDDSYISDGLTNTEILASALDFIEKAKKDIYKSATEQHTITASIKNLLVMPEFKDIIDNFSVGNWIRLEIDGNVYKLRLLDYTIDFSNLNNLSVTFSDVAMVYDGISDIQSILQSAASMATTYDSVTRKADKGNKSNELLNNWVEKGLNVTNTKIISNADEQSQVWDEHGMLFRKYNAIDDDYEKEQIKIINSTLAITDDGWDSVKTAVGGFYYYDTKTSQYKYAHGVNGETIVGKILLGEQMRLTNADNSLTFDNDGFTITNNKNTFTVNPNSNNLVKLSKTVNGTTTNLFYVDSNGVLHISGDGSGLDISANSSITGLSSSLQVTANQIYSTVSKAQSKYNTSGYTINYYGYSNPSSTTYPPADNNGKYYLNQNNGMLWTCNGTTWNYVKSLTLTTTYLQTQITQNSDNISLIANKNSSGTVLSIKPDAVKIAWNNIAEAIKFEGTNYNAQINIYNSNDKKLMSIDKNGQGFYVAGTKIGKIGTNTWSNTNRRGLVFDLDYDGDYMTWAFQQGENDQTYTTKWTYVGNNAIGTQTTDTLHAGCNIDLHSYYLKNPVLDTWSFKDGCINGTFSGIYITEMNSDGTAKTWRTFSLTFNRGILQSASW